LQKNFVRLLPVLAVAKPPIATPAPPNLTL
jgi:hypothetical protein